MKICFVAHYAYGALTGSDGGHIGGVERQTADMARWLLGRGHQVSIVTWQEGIPGDEIIDGIHVHKVCAITEGTPVLRFFHPRWTSLRAALTRADADVYVHNCAEAVTGQVALWAKRHGRGFVYSVASDPECDPALPILESYRERWLYRYGLRHANALLVQTLSQKAALQQGFGLESTLAKMPAPAPLTRELDAAIAAKAPRPVVLWIGRLAPVKDLPKLFELARQLPDLAFRVAGGVDQDAAYAARMMAEGEQIANVTMLGRQNPQQIADELRNAWVLACTSEYEGFPNAFLEAWSHARPIVSTVDPDNLIADKRLGISAQSVQALAEGIQRIVSSESCFAEYASRAHAYFYTHHEQDTAMQTFENVFQGAA